MTRTICQLPYATNSSGPLCLEPLYRAVKIFNFFIFQDFQKISSRGPSPICPMSPTGSKIDIHPAILESIGVKQQDSPSLGNPIPKAHSLRSLAFDNGNTSSISHKSNNSNKLCIILFRQPAGTQATWYV